MRKILLWLLLAASAVAQNFVPVTAANIGNGGPGLLAAGTATFQAVDATGAPISYRVGGGGQQIIFPTVCPVTAGALNSCSVANTATTNPVNVCFLLTIKSTSGAVVLGGSLPSGYGCLQPTGGTNSWCAAGSCNLDMYVPNLAGVPIMVLPPPTSLTLGGVFALSCTTGLVQTGTDATGRPICGSVVGTGNVVGSGLTSGVPLLGNGGSNIKIDTTNVVALTGADINASNFVVGLRGAALPALAAGYLNYTGSAWAFTNPLSSPTFTGTLTLPITGGTNQCLHVSTLGVLSGTGTDCGSGGGSAFQVNGVPLISSATVNYLNSAAFNGLTLTVSNPSSGVIQLGASGALGNNGLQNSSTNVNGQGCALGSNCTIPFQTGGLGNASQAGINFIASSANADGLTATPANPGTNQEKWEIAGTFTGALAPSSLAMGGHDISGVGNLTATGLLTGGSISVTGSSTFGTIAQTSTVSQHLLFGNCTGGTAAPSFCGPDFGMLPTATGDATISTAGVVQVTGLRSAVLPTLVAGYLNYTGSAWAFTVPVVPSPQYQVALYANGGTTGVVTGDAALTDNGSVLGYTGAVNMALLGFGNQAWCMFDNVTHLSTENCADYFENLGGANQGLRSGLIYSRPEIWARDPLTVNFSADMRFSTGPVNSTVCDDTTLPVTAWSITNNVLTITATNTLKLGAFVQLAGFGTSTFFNGQYVTVIAAGLSGSQFEASFAHANGGATEAGTFTPNLNCTIPELPVIMGASTTFVGLGPVSSAQNMSQGSLIQTSTGWFPPVGKPTLGTFTCSGTGGPGGTALQFAVQFDVNLESKPGKLPVRGFGAYATATVNCTGQGFPTATTVTITAPTGGAAGSLAHTDFSVGVASALNGDYYVQQAGTAMTCGVAGTFDTLNDCKTTGNAVIALASVQTVTSSFPMAASNKSGNPFDISNAMVAVGANAPVSFNEQFRDMALACPPTGHGVNNPNVLVVFFSSQEGSGTGNGPVAMYGDCGGYAGIAGAAILDLTQTPNSALTQLSISGGPTSGSAEYWGIALDGRGNAAPGAGAAGTARLISDVTIALKGGGTNNGDILAQGVRTNVGIPIFHGEAQNGLENLYVTNGAHVGLGPRFEGSTTGDMVRLTSTAGFSTGMNLCPQGIVTSSQPRCDPSAVAVRDDTDTSGTQPLLGQQMHWASGGSSSVLGNLTATGACLGCGVVTDHAGALSALSHTVSDTCTLGTSCAVTFTGTAVFTSAATYHCAANDATAANAVRVNQTSGSAVAFTGTGTDVISYTCSGH